MRTTLALAALLLLSPHAAAINKCVGADGKVNYQDTVCPDGKPVATSANTVERTEAERKAAKGELTPEQKKQAAADKKALAAQEEHAKMIQRKAQADESAQKRKNASVRSTVQRAGPTPAGQFRPQK